MGAKPRDRESVSTSGKIWALCQKRTSPKPRELPGARKPEKERVTGRERGPTLWDCLKTRKECKRNVRNPGPAAAGQSDQPG